MHLYVGGLVDRGQTSGLPCLHQVAGHLGLAVSRHHLALGEPGHIDGVACIGEDEFDAVVGRAFMRYALSHARLLQQVDGDLLKNAGPDAPEHVLRALTLDDDRIDACLVEQLAQQETSRACADDGHLCAPRLRGCGHGVSCGVEKKGSWAGPWAVPCLDPGL